MPTFIGRMPLNSTRLTDANYCYMARSALSQYPLTGKWESDVVMHMMLLGPALGHAGLTL